MERPRSPIDYISAIAVTGLMAMFGIAFMSQNVFAAERKAASKQPVASSDLNSLRELLKTPDSKLDLAKAKLTIDWLIDPTIDVAGTQAQLDAMASKIKARFPPGASQKTKLEYLVVALSQPGMLNGNHPFRYDLNDPVGKNIQNKLLPTYLATKQGNCVSMPILLVILGQKVGLEITLASAPEHMLAKFRNDAGEWIAVEATNFGYATDAWYQKELAISAKAMSNGLYLRPLSRRESAALMMGTLAEFYAQQGQQERRIAVAKLALQVNPKDVQMMLQEGNGASKLIDQRYRAKYRSPLDIPPDKREDYQGLLRTYNGAYDRAEALGWTRPTPGQKAGYLKVVEQAKAARNRGQ